MSWTDYLRPATDEDRAEAQRIVNQRAEIRRIESNPHLSSWRYTTAPWADYLRPKTQDDEIMTANEILASRDRIATQTMPENNQIGEDSFLSSMARRGFDVLSNMASGGSSDMRAQPVAFRQSRGVDPMMLLLIGGGVAALIYANR